MDLVLLFNLGAERYGLEVRQLQELVETDGFDYIPLAPVHYLGAINFHGGILPVLDLAGHLGLAAENTDHRVVVLAAEICSLALAVTRVGRIVSLQRDALLPPREKEEDGACIRALLYHDGEMINLLDLERLLASLETGG